ncbi:DUF2510 domain-containing protein [Streptomyces lomondensis]|uniref:Membrane protein n=1 Tax=Streptomyces lomondensis TaxID=68229 RepID=A0ABQ2XCM1_9ACTN|nr:DUF2510 domain-containing protein [Streptomyces lomondensis]MCF0080504.1 DUF2510 domain-containing protein [Streptomyces lomondensis]GGX09793.1 membrane protein [Streptomyces lomondensis]
MTPPPGWYPDPHAPHLQRWWDGTAWTEHRHAPEAPADPVPPPPDGGAGRTRAVAVTTAGAVLVAAIVTAAVALDGDGGGTDPRTAPTATSPAAPATNGAPEPTPETSASEPSADDPAVVEDQLNGVTFPLLDGWVRPQHIAQDDVVMTTDGTYDCPGGVGLCRHGLVFSRTVTENDEKSPEALAKADIEDAADEAYDRDRLGRELYGGIESHRAVKSGPVAVAGRAGYFVRWRVHTAEGPGGYVQSLVFPSSVGTESPVLVRYVFDAGEDGPPLADMDRITKGIRPFGDADTGGGVGSSIGPSD